MRHDVSDAESHALAERVGQALLARGLMLATAESCTGGLLAAAVTAVPGSSGWFERGFVTYSNQAKREMLGVHPGTLENHGAVSEAVVAEMAEGAISASEATVSVAVSGVAGPGGGSAAKPVGLVCLAWGMQRGESRARCVHCEGDREEVRRRAVVLALEGILEMLPGAPPGR
jgi:nicotinamide-nucleotide amidase